MEDRIKLDTEGSCIVDRFLDGDAVHLLGDELQRVDTQPAQAGRRESDIRIKRGAVFAMRNLLSAGFIQGFVAGPSVRALVDRISPGAIAVRAILFDKTGDANWTVPWHQDRSIAVRQRVDVAGFGPWSEKAGVVHVQPPVDLLREMVTLRFSLDACGPDNGPLRVIPGTHERILDAKEVSEAAHRGPQRACTTSAGGVVIMRPLLLHASSPARVASHRRILHIEFGPRTLPGVLQWAMA